MYDIVYLVRPGDKNEDLRYSLRSIDKFAPEHGKVWIIGYKPDWVKGVEYIHTQQPNQNNHWKDSRNNFLFSCKIRDISDDFILMNDDFIATRPIKNWDKSLSKVINTIDEQIIEWDRQGLKNRYTGAFIELKTFMQNQLGIARDLYNYELHMPMIINKKKLAELLNVYKIHRFIDVSFITLYRSLYGNYYNIPFNEKIEDVKFYNGDPKKITTEWISFFDNWAGNCQEYPLLNKFLQGTFSQKCRFEND